MRKFVTTVSMLGACLALTACNTEYAAFDEAKAQNTPEAYRAFLEEYPDGVNKAAAEERLDHLDWGVAESENTAAAYEKYLADHPEGAHVTEAELAAPKLAWQDVDYGGDVAQLTAFLERWGNSAYAKKAEERKALLELAPKHLEIGAPQLEALEGGGKWAVRADVKNIGEVPVVMAQLRVSWSNADGRVGRSKEWYLVVEDNPKYDSPEELVEPLKPGDTRTFEFIFRRKEASEDWPEDEAHVGLDLVDLKLQTEAPAAS